MHCNPCSCTSTDWHRLTEKHTSQICGCFIVRWSFTCRELARVGLRRMCGSKKHPVAGQCCRREFNHWLLYGCFILWQNSSPLLMHSFPAPGVYLNVAAWLYRNEDSNRTMNYLSVVDKMRVSWLWVLPLALLSREQTDDRGNINRSHYPEMEGTSVWSSGTLYFGSGRITILYVQSSFP